MSKIFTYQLNESRASLLERIQLKAKEASMTFVGDENSGTLTGKGIDASYEITEAEIKITVNKKPFVLLWSIMETAINKFITNRL